MVYDNFHFQPASYNLASEFKNEVRTTKNNPEVAPKK